MIFQPFSQFKCIGASSFHTQAQCFKSLQKQITVERTYSRSKIPQTFYPGSYSKSNISERAIFTEYFPEFQTMISFRWLRKLWKFSIPPIEITTVDDHTTDRSTMPANPFRSRLNHYIGSMLDRTEKISCRSKCIVDDQRQIMFLRNRRKGFKIRYVIAWICDSLQINSAGIFVDFVCICSWIHLSSLFYIETKYYLRDIDLIFTLS